jgi:hypothetical protein
MGAILEKCCYTAVAMRFPKNIKKASSFCPHL